MKRRGIARTTAMAMAAAMILTACGGGKRGSVYKRTGRQQRADNYR